MIINRQKNNTMKKITQIPKIFLIPLLLISIAGKAQNPYQNTLIMNDAVGQINSMIVVDVELCNYDLVKDVTFDVPLPDGFTYVAQSAIINPARSRNHYVISGVLTNTNILRIIATNNSLLPLIGNSGIILSYTLTTPDQTGVYELNFENAFATWGSGSYCAFVPDTINGIATIIQNIQLLPGDSNCNGSVNVMDIVITVKYMFGDNPQPFCFENTDLNEDGIIDITDAVNTVNIIINRR